MIKQTKKFKEKGTSILMENRQQRPYSMEDFLKDSPEKDEKNTPIHKNTVPQLHKTINPQIHSISTVHQEELGRLHIQIRQDLVDKLLGMVFKRKRDPKVNNRTASQRAIIEEALEIYFKNEANLPND